MEGAAQGVILRLAAIAGSEHCVASLSLAVALIAGGAAILLDRRRTRARLRKAGDEDERGELLRRLRELDAVEGDVTRKLDALQAWLSALEVPSRRADEDSPNGR